jgi:hypothetical protein
LAGLLKSRGIEGEALREALYTANEGAFDPVTGELNPLPESQVEKIYRQSLDWDLGVRPILDDAGRPIPIAPPIEIPLNDKDKPIYSVAILERILTTDLDYKGHLRRNLISDRKLYRGRVLDDCGILDMRNRLIEKYHLTIPKDDMFDMVALVCSKNSFDPIQDYLKGLVWDGLSRLDPGAKLYFGAGEALEGMYFRLWMIGAVARAMRPGCKMDNALVLQGGTQGKQKSTALATLAGDDWFSDSALDLKNKDAYQGMRSKWIWEWSELETKFKRSDRSEIKAFLSSKSDTYRPSYGREVIDVPRRCVIASSTNEEHFLFDDTGNRRFWILRCGDIDIAALRRDRDQLWAEAVHRHKAGERHWTTLEEQSKGEEHALGFMEENPWSDKVALAITEQRTRAGWDGWVDQALLYERCGESWTSAQSHTKRHINSALRELGFASDVRRLDGKCKKGFRER